MPIQFPRLAITIGDRVGSRSQVSARPDRGMERSEKADTLQQTASSVKIGRVHDI
jgi:hypothetical protein